MRAQPPLPAVGILLQSRDQNFWCGLHKTFAAPALLAAAGIGGVDITFTLRVTVFAGTKPSRDASSMAWHPQDGLALLIQGLLIPPVQMSIGIVIFNSLFFLTYPTMNCRCSLQKNKTSCALSSYLSQIGVYPNEELIATLWVWLLISRLEKHPGVFRDVIHPLAPCISASSLWIAAVSVQEGWSVQPLCEQLVGKSEEMLGVS